jgi:hypothetical protein
MSPKEKLEIDKNLKTYWKMASWNQCEKVMQKKEPEPRWESGALRDLTTNTGKPVGPLGPIY